jgi:hypothetical protein
MVSTASWQCSMLAVIFFNFMGVFMPLNNPGQKCHSARFLNDEVQCQHACSQGVYCPLHPSKPATTPPPLYRAGSTDLDCDESGWLFDTTWTDWAGAVIVLIIIGIICGYMQ